jgi:hypothetical protein
LSLFDQIINIRGLLSTTLWAITPRVVWSATAAIIILPGHSLNAPYIFKGLTTVNFSIL